MNLLRNIISITFALALLAAGVFAQQEENVNFGYSKNPPAKTAPKPRQRVVSEENTPSDATEKMASTPTETPVADPVAEKPRFESVAKKTREIAKEESLKLLKPTEFYRVGSGDVLFVSLQESKSSYYTVLSDGSIDYPLAGGLINVAGLTVSEIEDLLREKIQLYEHPEVSVNIREHASHAIDVLGLVERTGKQYLQREAMPLYVIRAQAIARPDSDLVVIKRADSTELTVKSGTPGFDETLVFPGDVVEFASSASAAAAGGFVYVGGSVANAGRFGFYEGMTLTQAIMTAGGLTGDKIKEAVVRRKDERGFLESTTYKLADIKKGKLIDPVLEAGDMVEVGN